MVSSHTLMRLALLRTSILWAEARYTPRLAHLSTGCCAYPRPSPAARARLSYSEVGDHAGHMSSSSNHRLLPGTQLQRLTGTLQER